MPFRLIPRSLRKNSKPQSHPVRLTVTPLEEREVPSVTLADPNGGDFMNDKPLFVPVTNTATVNGSTTYTATSDNANVTVSVLPAGQTLKLDVSGVDKNGAAFSGTLTFRLFADAAPLAVQRIVDLVGQGFYNGKTFFRTMDNFVIQGGSSNNTAADPGTVPNIQDEFNADYTFNSLGILAFANATDDANGTQFFVTDIDVPLANRPQFLNFNHTIFGQLTSGFDTFTKIIQGTVKSGTQDQAQNPATITSASIITDNANGVVRVVANNGFTGTANVTVNGVDGDNVQQSKTFAVNAVADTADDRPFLQNIPDASVTSGSQKTIVLPVVNLDGDSSSLVYRVGVPGNLFGTPANVTTSVNNATGELTITAAAGFTGTVQLLVGVRDNTDRTGNGVSDPANFDTQVMNVTVTAPGPATVNLSASKTSPQANRTVLLTANVSGDNTSSGTIAFLDGATVLGSTKVLDGRANLSVVFSTTGAHAITATFTPTGGSSSTATSNAVSLNVVAGTAPQTFTAAPVTMGNLPIVVAKKPDNTELFTAQPFEASFTGGVRVAIADVTGDGQMDLITVAGFGGGPIIDIYDGTDGTLLRSVQIFENTFRGGLYVDAKDALGKGYSQILIGAGFTGGPRVSLYDFVQDKVVLNYFAYDSALRSGVAVSLSDLRGGEQFQILTVPGQNGAPAVSVFNARRPNDDGFPVPVTVGSFFAGSTTDTTGKRIGAGDLGSNGVRKIQVFAFDDTATSPTEFDPIAQGLYPSS